MQKIISLPQKTLKRLAHYHFYLEQMDKKQRDYVSRERLASDLNLPISEINEDLEQIDPSLSISEIHSVKLLLRLVEEYLGYQTENSAVLAGAGNLGRALLNYRGFKSCGLEIKAIFDRDKNLQGDTLGGLSIMDPAELENVITRLKVKIGIICTPAESAQIIAKKMINSGIKGIWNFSPAVIKVPDKVIIQNTSIYNDLLKLSHRIKTA